MKYRRLFAMFALFVVASTALMAQNEPADRNGKAPSGLALSDLANSANQAAAIVDRAIRASGGHARLDCSQVNPAHSCCRSKSKIS